MSRLALASKITAVMLGLCAICLTPTLDAQSTLPDPAPLSANQGVQGVQQAGPATQGTQGGQENEVLPPPPPEDSVGEPARLSDVEGSVQLVDRTGKLFDQARLNMEFDPGMRVETGNDGRAEIEFPDGSIARVTPNSTLEFAALNPDPASTTPVTLKPTKGLTYYEFAPPSAAGGSQVSVEIGKLWAVAARSSAQQSAGQQTLLRVSLDLKPYEAAVLRGRVHVQDAGGDSSFDLDANQTARIDPESATNYDTAQELTPDTWDAWNGDRDSLLAQLAGAGAQSRSGEPNTAGWNDLDYYGSWYNVPDQGPGWAPDGVGADFDPYGSGAWSYYSNAGYTWTSSYPWGWLPYHCGYWNYYGQSGWLWMPNGCGWSYGGVWYPYGGLHRLPQGYQPPRRPAPPRGANPHPPRELIAVNRGTPVHFRGVGEPRLPARSFAAGGSTLTPLPPMPRYSYSPSGVGGVSGAGASPIYRGGVPTFRLPGSSMTAAPHAITPPPRTIYTPPPAPSPPMHVMPPVVSGGHPR